ncbi:hypothetical protein [Deinococcus soli (ex Cha et al. 2016)]|uniref:Uncharacterized protein n=2 Tax=Deinococcus soli (ex Cha et al. 2016) TaxID=1309411 RepID=A0ACC6KG49_9DEIO|nr:hypothetical protein [Deinococcus soli (ex Cha et al. 2016)]MDR6218521.1 hypothetical protein [Deinococcus soli (ex Cha et al. 2016)]MDR6329261.1 hypothetical protein [Deinococcus soli (ex Cha et al. 2016)]MDR6751534.1 hypothetical protein [Deinococcus soli (ex Cha et al. 2016)]
MNKFEQLKDFLSRYGYTALAVIAVPFVVIFALSGSMGCVFALTMFSLVMLLRKAHMIYQQLLRLEEVGVAIARKK